MQQAPGRSDRSGITIFQLFSMFPDEESARRWMEAIRWPDGPACPTCGSVNYGETPSHKSMDYRCRDCRQYFSVRKGTAMESSKIALRQWAIAIYMSATNPKGVSSMKIHRELGMTQKSAWFLIQRVREFFADAAPILTGPVEVDETYVGGLEKNRHKSEKMHAGRGTAGKATVMGARQRDGKIVARPLGWEPGEDAGGIRV